MLIHVANVLKDHLRDSDYLSRRGGEEFLGLLVGISPYQAQQVIGRALAELNREAIIYNDNMIKVSFSAGISELNESVTVENAIQEADKQMYIAKKMGNNTIVSNNKITEDKRTSFIAAS